MNLRTLAAVAIAATTLGAGTLAATQADAAPPPYPTGTFSENTTSQYLTFISGGLRGNIDVTVDSLSPGAFVDSIDPGTQLDGSGTYPWRQLTFESPVIYRISYGEAGTFTPRMFVTDADNQTTIVTLPSVTILTDTSNATGDVTLPAASVRNKISGWRILKGHAVDPQTGVRQVQLNIMQRRKGVWWVYSSSNERWRKGNRSETWTRQHVITAYAPAQLVYHGTDWTQYPIKGLTSGLLAVKVTLHGGNGVDVNLPIVRHYLG